MLQLIFIFITTSSLSKHNKLSKNCDSIIIIIIIVGAQRPKKGLLGCSVDIGASHARGGSSLEKGRWRGKRFLGASGGKDWLR